MKIRSSKEFVSSFFRKNTTAAVSSEFIRENGLVGFSNAGDEYRDELRTWEVRKMRLNALLNELLDRFPEINFTPWKGKALEGLYPSGSIRIYSDIDLLVTKNDFRKLRSFLPRENESLIFRKSGLEIEIKYDFLDRFFSFFMPFERQKTLKGILGKLGEDGLNPYHVFILLSIHNLAHMFSRLDRFFDLYFLSSSEDFKWAELMAEARRLKADKYVRYNIALMGLLEFPIGKEAVLNSFEKSVLVRMYSRQRALYRIGLVILNLNPIAAFLFVAQKALFLDIPYTRKVIKQFRARRKRK